MYFNCVAADNIFRRKIKFLNKIKQANNSLCRAFVAKTVTRLLRWNSCVVLSVVCIGILCNAVIVHCVYCIFSAFSFCCFFVESLLP